MATMRQIDTRFWKDNWVRKINALDRYAFIYLLTNDNCSWCGIYELPLSVMAFESGIDERDLENSILPRLSEKILYVDGWVFIKNFIKYHDTGSPNSKKGIENAISEVPSEILAKIKEKTNSSKPLATVGNCRHTSSSSSSSSSNKDFPKKNHCVSSDELVYEPLEGEKTKGAFLNRARAKRGKPPMLRKDPTTWNIIDKYRIQYQYIMGRLPLVGDADYFHVLAVTKKMNPEDMEAMVIWYIRTDNEKFKKHPNLKSIFTVENINLFNATK